MASKSYRVDTWEICEGHIEYSGNNFKAYLYEVVLFDYMRFTNLLAYYVNI